MIMALQAHIANPENFDCFRDALSSALIEKISTSTKTKTKPRRRTKSTITARPTRKVDRFDNQADTETNNSNNNNNSAEDLAEFTDYIATLAFETLPSELQSLTHRTWSDCPSLQEKYTLPLTSTDLGLLPEDPSLTESLVTYNILSPPHSDLSTFLAPVLTTYLVAITSPPPPPASTRKATIACEICERDWVPLTYHHLIPRFVHTKAVKRGWHREEDLANVAWLCRACHSFVHRFAGHEVLAREYYTVEKLLEAEEVRSFAGWVSRVRWKAK